jgi:hypothetical protein
VTRAFALAAVLLAVTAPAAAAKKPDLKVSTVSPGTASVAAGSMLSVADTTENSGAARAGRSTTRFYVSTDPARSGGDTRLGGKHGVGALGTKQASESVTLAGVPLDAPPGPVFVLACADDRDQVAEKREDNNCRVADDQITIELPDDCLDALVTLGIAYEAGPDAPGVTDPVTVETPINGISYFTNGGQNDPEVFMDCTLALALHAMGEEMETRGLTGVEHAGVYNYRCIGGGTPPDCPNGLSRHAYADAFDVLELRGAGGETYNVNDDWVIDPVDGTTCNASTESAKDALLHAFVCALHETGAFHILLTPNYNADQRNHIHLDLTPEASFIE